MLMGTGFHISEKGAAVFAYELSAAADSGMDNINNTSSSKYC